MSMYREHLVFSEAHPEWMQLALVVVNRWGTQQDTLTVSIAKALQEAYAMGTEGTPPEYHAPIQRISRRAAVAPPPAAVRRRTRL